MLYKPTSWRNWYSTELDENNNRKLREDTPKEIKKEYEEYLQKKKDTYLKEHIIY